MAMTDPLGDMLTRIRNGQQARKDSVLSPASKLRARVLDVLQREGYIRGYREEELARSAGPAHRAEIFRGPARDPARLARVSKPGRRVYSGAQELPRDPQRPRHHHRLDAQAAFCRTRKRATRMSAAKCWRRCSDVAASARSRSPMPAGVTASDRRPDRSSVKGPKGTLSHADARRDRTTRSARTAIRVTAGQRRRKQARAFWGMQRTLRAEPRHRRDRGLHQGARDHRRRLSRRRPRARTCGCSSATATTSTIAVPEGIDDQDARPDHGRDQRHRQAEGRPGRRRDPPLAQARALQGQGHQVSRRVYLPQRRQEEVAMAKLSLFDRRRRRVRTALRAHAAGTPRLSVHRSGRHIYAQVIDDAAGRTLAAASTLDKDCKGQDRRDQATAPRRSARRIAERAKAAGVIARRVRPRRLPVPWPRQGAGRRRPRRRTGVLNG